MKKYFSVLLIMALFVTTALCGCKGGTNNSSEDKPSNGPTEAPTQSVTEKTYGGSVVVGIQQDIDSLDPHKATAAGTKEILFNLFEGLVKADKDGNLMNAVASDYTISDDGLVYTFTLRDGIKFHNGNLVTAEDVKYSLERVSGLLDGTPLMSTMSVITAVDIVDEKTVSVTVSGANTELIYSFVAAIIPKGSGEEAGANPVGTGPFSFVSYTPQEGIKVKKFDSYWQAGLPYLDDVYFKIVNGADAALLALKGETIDVYAYLTDSQANELKSIYNVVSSPSNVVQAVFLNNEVAPLDNVKVRQAICYAIDKDMVNEFVGGGTGTIISAAMLPSLKNYYNDLNGVYGTTANVEKAKALLKEAGFENGFDLEISIPSNYEFHMQTGEVIVEQLKAVGINAKIKSMEWSSWLDECYNGRQYQATISGITCDMTPGYLLNRFQSASKKNFVNYKNEAYDALYVKAHDELNQTQKEAYYKELQKMICDDAISAFIQVPGNTTAISKKLAGYEFYPIYVQDMSTVYFVK